MDSFINISDYETFNKLILLKSKDYLSNSYTLTYDNIIEYINSKKYKSENSINYRGHEILKYYIIDIILPYSYNYKQTLEIYGLNLNNFNKISDYFVKEFNNSQHANFNLLKSLFNNYYQIKNNSSNQFDSNIEIKKIILSNCENYLNQKMIEQPEFLNTELFSYQKANIYWMIHRENNGFDILIPSYPILNINHKYDFNVIKNQIEKKDTSINKIKLIGGCLSDDVGLGKTIQVLTMCMLHKVATLIIVPNHLENHWINEFKKHLKDEYIDSFNKIVTICNYSEYKDILKKNKYERIIIDEYHELFSKDNNYLVDIMQKSDSTYFWMITATPFTSNSILNSMIKIIGRYKSWNFDLGKYRDYIPQYAEIFRRNTKESIKQELLFPKIMHHKYYIDFSEIEKNYYDSIILSKNYSNFDLNEVLRQFCINPNISEFIFDKKDEDFVTIDEIKPRLLKYFNEKINNIKSVIDNYEKKNSILSEEITKLEKINKDIKIKLKKHNEIVKLIKSKKEQRNNCNDSNEKNKLSNHIKKLEKEIILDSNDISYYTSTIFANDQNINNLQSEIVTNTNYLKPYLKERDTYLISLKQIDRNTNIIKKSLSITEKTGEDNSDDESEEEKCGICLGDFEDTKDFTVLSCGHMYCLECFQSIKYHNKGMIGKCQQCQTSLSNVKIINIKNNSKKNNTTYELLINKYGTKIAFIIDNILKNNSIFDNKIVIYSSWDKCLGFMNKVLNENDIKTLYPSNDNLYESIKQFENDDYKVLLLSSECNASGLNITKARNIILLNPLSGNYNYRKQITNQMIGRLHRIGQKSDINVIDIIIKNTIENLIDKENKIADNILEKTLDDRLLLKTTQIEHN